MPIAAFAAGFVTGWIARSSVDSTRGVAVRAVSGVLSAIDAAQRIVALEREYFEDLVAEGRARYEARKQRKSAKSPVSLVTDKERSAS
jgi:hypothetical protein